MPHRPRLRCRGAAPCTTPRTRRRGYLEIRTRSGNVERVLLITLTVALIVDAHGRFAHPAALSDTLAELKRFGKTMAGSVVVKERRNPAEPHELVTSAPAQDEERAHDSRS